MSKFFSMTTLFSSILLLSHGYAENDPLIPKEIKLDTPVLHGKMEMPTRETRLERKSPPTVKASFSPFTGKILADKVRIRLQPDLDGYILRELNKNEVISIIDQEGDFYCIQPPESFKAYVFRSFVIDNVVEGNRVNVRLDPDLESPIIGHLNSGDRISGQVCTFNKKWLEITPPSSTRFYVAKDFIENIGGPEVKGRLEKRKETVDQLLEAAKLYSKNEMEKPFEQIEFDQVKKGYLTIIQDYSDFPSKIELAKEGFNKVQEEYLQKRISYLENKASQIETAAATPQSTEFKPTRTILNSASFRSWKLIEDGLFASWKQQNEDKSLDQFYKEQKTLAITLTGVLEVFKSPVKNKPGDFVLKDKNLPVAYVYSTLVDLENYVGKKVTLVGIPRSNNNFAFPAYFINEVE